MTETFKVRDHSIELAARETVGPPTPYTLLLAENIPPIDGKTVVDIGTGSGFIAIVACLQGAAKVYILDTNPAAIQAAVSMLKETESVDAWSPCPSEIRSSPCRPRRQWTPLYRTRLSFLCRRPPKPSAHTMPDRTGEA